MSIKVSRKTTAKVTVEGTVDINSIIAQDEFGNNVQLTLTELFDLINVDEESKVKITVQQVFEEEV